MKCWVRQAFNDYLCEGLKRIEAGENIGNPFPLLTGVDDPWILKKAAERHCSSFAKQRPLPRSARTSTENQQRITIAYFSSDLDTAHPVGANLRPLLEAHDRQRFKLIAFNLSENPDANLLGYFDEVNQGSRLSDTEMAGRARNQAVDIAVDLNGYTEGSRIGIFAHRAAPIQINYLGYPGTMGTSFHDFIVADSHVIPPSKEAAFSEKILRLPHFLMPYDFTLEGEQPTPSAERKVFELPENAFVFCSFNDFHKISEEMLACWIEILHKTHHTVFWLAVRGDISEHEIRECFESGGIERERLILARRVASHPQHLARLRLADMMLDTFPYNSHTTACDAVKCGLPVLTLCGESYHSRVCGSLLNQVDASYLITSSFSEYKHRAIELACNSKRFASVRDAFRKGRARLPPPGDFARSLERLYASTLK